MPCLECRWRSVQMDIPQRLWRVSARRTASLLKMFPGRRIPRAWSMSGPQCASPGNLLHKWVLCRADCRRCCQRMQLAEHMSCAELGLGWCLGPPASRPTCTARSFGCWITCPFMSKGPLERAACVVHAVHCAGHKRQHRSPASSALPANEKQAWSAMSAGAHRGAAGSDSWPELQAQHAVEWQCCLQPPAAVAAGPARQHCASLCLRGAASWRQDAAAAHNHRDSQ